MIILQRLLRLASCHAPGCSSTAGAFLFFLHPNCRGKKYDKFHGHTNNYTTGKFTYIHVSPPHSTCSMFFVALHQGHHSHFLWPALVLWLLRLYAYISFPQSGQRKRRMYISFLCSPVALGILYVLMIENLLVISYNSVTGVSAPSKRERRYYV